MRLRSPRKKTPEAAYGCVGSEKWQALLQAVKYKIKEATIAVAKIGWRQMDPEANKQLLCALFGKLSWEKDSTVDNGIIAKQANRYAKQFEADFWPLLAPEDTEERQRAITTGNRLDLNKLWSSKAVRGPCTINNQRPWCSPVAGQGAGGGKGTRTRSTVPPSMGGLPRNVERRRRGWGSQASPSGIGGEVQGPHPVREVGGGAGVHDQGDLRPGLHSHHTSLAGPPGGAEGPNLGGGEAGRWREQVRQGTAEQFGEAAVAVADAAALQHEAELAVLADDEEEHFFP